MTRYLDLLIWLSFFAWLWLGAFGVHMTPGPQVTIVILFVADVIRLAAASGTVTKRKD